MISARGPDSASADEPRIDVRAPLLRVARQTPDRSTKRRPASAGASNRAVGPASNPFPSGLLPSGIGMAKPTIQQARDRAEVLWGATRPEWVTSAGSLERPYRALVRWHRAGYNGVRTHRFLNKDAPISPASAIGVITSYALLGGSLRSRLSFSVHTPAGSALNALLPVISQPLSDAREA